MNRNLTGVSVFLVALLFFGGLFFPEHPMMWIASTSDGYALVRIVLAAVLIGLLYSRPPRKRSFRKVLGLAAAVFGGWAAILTLQSSMYILDIFIFLQSAIVFAIAALEFEPREDTLTVSETDEAQSKRRFVIDPLVR